VQGAQGLIAKAAKKKKPARISPDSSVREKPRKKHSKAGEISFSAKPRILRRRGWMVCGFDTSMSSLAGAAMGYDSTLKKFKGPVFTERRWSRDDHYYDRLNTAARSHDLVLELQHQLGLELNLEEAWIAQEEPWPVGMVGGNKHVSGWLKQQAEISGAFLGSLVRYGWQNVAQINSMKWRTMIADMIFDSLGERISTHHSKWRSPELALKYNCKPEDSGKFRAKQWALDVMAPYFGQQMGTEIPDWPDLIMRTHGLTPRPEDSSAKAAQPDDRYDALAVMWWYYHDLSQAKLLDLE
jgi:hypothetical protein